MEIVFDNFKSAKLLMETWHYSRKISRYPVVIGCYVDGVQAIAAAVVGLPTSRWGRGDVKVLELNRLVRAESVSMPPLSKLVSAIVKEAKRRKCGDLLISFADSGQGHHGGVYQACSWFYGGLRKPRIDGCLIDGQFYAARTCNNKWGTSSPDKLGKLLQSQNVVGHMSPGKHLYWRPLNKIGAKFAADVKLMKLPYPKPNA